MAERFVTCNFCKGVYDMELKPKPLLIQSKGPSGPVSICKSCIGIATGICKQELGPDWPKKKEPK